MVLPALSQANDENGVIGKKPVFYCLLHEITNGTDAGIEVVEIEGNVLAKLNGQRSFEIAFPEKKVKAFFHLAGGGNATSTLTVTMLGESRSLFAKSRHEYVQSGSTLLSGVSLQAGKAFGTANEKILELTCADTASIDP